MAAQRLDKIIASTGRWSRREVKELIRQGRVTVDGVPARGAEEKAGKGKKKILHLSFRRQGQLFLGNGFPYAYFSSLSLSYSFVISSL